MDRLDFALTLTSKLAASDGEQFPLDRIRVQKGIFLLTQRGNPAWRSFYTYKPYNWGPYSSQLAADTDLLALSGLLRVQDVPGARHGGYETTPAGEARADAVWASFTAKEQSFIRTVRAYVTTRSFTQLLREVYAAYPDFATASQFTG